jgi:UDP-N-acetyl-D-galactosamine dehydrogenase
LIFNYKIGIIGLGYVGLPLAVAFAEKYPVIGYDINKSRVKELLDGLDSTLEIESFQLKSVLRTSTTNGFFPTSNSADLASCNIYIVTVPTPTDKHNMPFLTPNEITGQKIQAHFKEQRAGDVRHSKESIEKIKNSLHYYPKIKFRDGLQLAYDWYLSMSA